MERRHFARAVGNYSHFAHSLPTVCGARILFSERTFGRRSIGTKKQPPVTRRLLIKRSKIEPGRSETTSSSSYGATVNGDQKVASATAEVAVTVAAGTVRAVPTAGIVMVLPSVSLAVPAAKLV